MTSSAIDCDVITRTTTERVRHGDDVYRSSFLSSLMDSVCRVRNKIMFLRSFECYYFDVYFPHCFATREINTKIILSWALKQFVTRVHKLFSIYTIVAGTVWTCTSSKLLYRFPLIYVVAFVSCQEVMVYVEPQGIWILHSVNVIQIHINNFGHIE